MTGFRHMWLVCCCESSSVPWCRMSALVQQALLSAGHAVIVNQMIRAVRCHNTASLCSLLCNYPASLCSYLSHNPVGLCSLFVSHVGLFVVLPDCGPLPLLVGSTINLMKVDVERAEWQVLQGIQQQHWPLIQQVAMEVRASECHEHMLVGFMQTALAVGGKLECHTPLLVLTNRNSCGRSGISAWLRVDC